MKAKENKLLTRVSKTNEKGHTLLTSDVNPSPKIHEDKGKFREIILWPYQRIQIHENLLTFIHNKTL
jgi:hypothetical protein